MNNNTPFFNKVRDNLISKKFNITGENLNKPWGAYYLIDEKQTPQFIKEFFSHIKLPPFNLNLKLSPKILMVAPGKKLSWQYHHRRRELWTILEGPVEIVINKSDQLIPGKKYYKDDFIDITLGERHRLIGLDQWGVVAEIWLHAYPKNPSNEEDIIRVQDDFNR